MFGECQRDYSKTNKQKKKSYQKKPQKPTLALAFFQVAFIVNHYFCYSHFSVFPSAHFLHFYLILWGFFSHFFTSCHLIPNSDFLSTFVMWMILIFACCNFISHFRQSNRTCIHTPTSLFQIHLQTQRKMYKLFH